MDGFFIQKNFKVRELGYYSWQGDRGSYLFDIKIRFRDLNDKTKRQLIMSVKTLLVSLSNRPTEKDLSIIPEHWKT